MSAGGFLVTPDDPRASIRTREDRCARQCRLSWEIGLEGDVRRCEHGRIWIATGRTSGSYYLSVWRRLWRLWTPIAYRRAVKALNESEAQP